MTQDKLRAMLEQDMEAVISEVLAQSEGKEMDLTAIEDVALAARQEFGRRVAQRLAELQVTKQAALLPAAADGKHMSPKGKKTEQS